MISIFDLHVEAFASRLDSGGGGIERYEYMYITEIRCFWSGLLPRESTDGQED